jgi:single-strand DNA-binding protein
MVATFSIATTERQKDASGNWTDKTEWHNLVAFTKLAEIVRDYVKKGSKLYIEGRLNTRNWEDKETKKKLYRTEIIVNDLSLLSAREEGSGGYSKSQSSSSSSASFDQRPAAAAGGSDEYSQQAEISDDDIPF